MLPTSEDLTGMKVEDLENFLETPLLSSERLVVAAVAVVDFEDPGQLNSLESSWSGRPDCWTTRKMGNIFRVDLEFLIYVHGNHSSTFMII